MLCTLFLLWPALWDGMFLNLTEAYNLYSQYTRSGGLSLFNGQLVQGTNLSFYYTPVWIFLTTPPFQILLFLIGLIVFISYLKGSAKVREPLLLCGSVFFLIAPLVYVSFRKSVLYDDWRHMQFLYVPISLIAFYALDFVYAHLNKKFLMGFSLSLLFSLLFSFYSLIKIHPFQNVYFNIFAGENWNTRFPMDYWGLSGKQLLENFFTAPNIDFPVEICCRHHGNTSRNLYMIKDPRKDLISFSCYGHEKYRFYYYYPGEEINLDDWEELYSNTVNGQKISSVLVKKGLSTK